MIPWNSLSTFFGLSFGLHNRIQYGYFFTNTYDYCDEINKTNKIVTYGGNYFDNLTSKHFKNISKMIDGDEIEFKKYVPRDYQKEIIELAKEHYSEETLGHLIMACGTGKSLTSYWIAKNYRKVVIFVPSLLLLSQFYNDYMKAIIGDDEYEYNVLLVGSDCDNNSRIKEKMDAVNITTDKKEILKFLRDTNGENKIVFSTYQSSYILDEILKETDLFFNFGIYDEVHKTCMKENRMMSKMIECESINKKLFMTATAKILKDTKNDEEDDKVYSMDDEEVYGKKIYEYNITDAIRDKRLCDYRIYNVHTTEKEMKKLIKNDRVDVVLKDIRLDEEMNMKYVTAGMMIIKSFNELSCTHLITYHNTIANAKIFTELLGKLFKKYFDNNVNISMVDGGISIKKRRKIINDFQESDYGIICSCRSLCEGINIPIVDSLCFVDSRSSTIDLIQCIGRSLRTFNGKKESKILMPILLEDFDEYDGGKYSELVRVLKALNICDTELISQLNSADGCNSKRGRIIKNIFMEDSFEEDYEINIDEFCERLEMKLWKKSDSWHYMLEKVKKYINENNCRPGKEDVVEYRIKQMGMWVANQLKNFKATTEIMKKKEIYEEWKKFMEEYEEYFRMPEEIWHDNLNKLKRYIDGNKKKPSIESNDDKVRKLSIWMSNQIKNVKIGMQIMGKKEINEEWNKFIEEYKKYFKMAEEDWYKNLNEVKKYIDANKKKPGIESNNNKIKKLSRWLVNQINKFKKKIFIMKKKEIYKEWQKFVDVYGEYFKTTNEKWNENLNEVKKYIDIHKKRPCTHSKNSEIKKIGLWLVIQIKNAKTTYFIKDKEKHKKWDKFMKEYKEYFKTNEEKWYENLNKVKEYIKENKKLPDRRSYNTTKISIWLSRQIHNYKKEVNMFKNKKIGEEFFKFIKEHEKYF